MKINKKLIIFICGLAIIGLAAIVVDTKFYIYIGAIFFCFIILSIFLNIKKIKKNISKNLTIILEDETRFYVYFKKRFPMSCKYLPLVKIVSLLLLLTAISVDYEAYTRFSLYLTQESIIPSHTVEYYYSKYAFCLYLSIIVYEYMLCIYITLNANHPVRNAAYQIAKHTAKAVGASSALAVVIAMHP